MIPLQETYEKLATLSEERARRVSEIVDDLAELQAVEDAQDLASAKAALERIAAGEETYSLTEFQKQIGL